MESFRPTLRGWLDNQTTLSWLLIRHARIVEHKTHTSIPLAFTSRSRLAFYVTVLSSFGNLVGFAICRHVSAIQGTVHANAGWNKRFYLIMQIYFLEIASRPHCEITLAQVDIWEVKSRLFLAPDIQKRRLSRVT